MKTTAILLVCVVACFWNKAHADCPPFENGASDTKVPTGSKVVVKCNEYTCEDDGGWASVGCPEFRCENPKAGSQGYDYSKPYPDCCPKSVC